MKSTIDMFDDERIQLNKLLINKSVYSQYLTPISVCPFMASLTAAFLERLISEEKTMNIKCILVEFDDL